MYSNKILYYILCISIVYAARRGNPATTGKNHAVCTVCRLIIFMFPFVSMSRVLY